MKQTVRITLVDEANDLVQLEVQMGADDPLGEWLKLKGPVRIDSLPSELAGPAILRLFSSSDRSQPVYLDIYAY